jgi:glycosyltransferase involved in cell wall biosynthesis
MTLVKSILFVTYHFPPEVGGIQTRIYHYVTELSRRRICVAVMYLTTKLVRTRNYKLNGTEVIQSCGKTKYLFSNLPRLIKLGVSNEVDVIHVFTGGTTLFGMLSLIVGRILGVSAVFSFFGVEGVVFESFSEKARFIISASLATSVATNSEAMKRLVPKQFRSKTCTVLGGSDTASLPSQATDYERPQIIMSAGRLVRSKGMDDLIEAFSTVRKSFPRARLVIVGDGPERDELERKASDLGLSMNVEFKGVLRGRDLQSEYQESSVFVLASKRVVDDPATEAFGLVLVEAAMHGKPLVGTRIGGIPEIIRDGVNGILVPQSDPNKLAEALLKLLSDKKLILDMGLNAFEIAKAEYTWSNSTDRLLKCYQRH